MKVTFLFFFLAAVSLAANAEGRCKDGTKDDACWVATNTGADSNSNVHKMTLKKYKERLKKCRSDSTCFVSMQKQKPSADFSKGVSGITDDWQGPAKYGWYCGAGHGSQDSQLPLDPVDACCKQHDEGGNQDRSGLSPFQNAGRAAKCFNQIDTNMPGERNFSMFGPKRVTGNMEEARRYWCRAASVASDHNALECD